MRFVKKEYRKYWILSVWIVISAYLIFSFAVVDGDIDVDICGEVIITIDGDSPKKFISEGDILEMLKKENIEIINTPIQNIDNANIETILEKHPSIKKVDVYKIIGGKLKIDIHQRKPIIRIISKNGNSFYLDELGKPMPASPKYTAHLLVAHGNIPNANFNASSENYELPKMYNNLYELVQFLNEDEILEALIVEIYVNKKDELEMFPRIGNQNIYFGGFENFERKFKKLTALYKQGFSKYGWAKYKSINLNYKNQVVCKIK